ncbi:MAG: hypothetical protein M3021_00045, partial [Actinomycetota bacterium]|nr:hypothetical protein [Actinomycetota bacterium]
FLLLRSGLGSKVIDKFADQVLRLTACFLCHVLSLVAGDLRDVRPGFGALAADFLRLVLGARSI